MRDCKRQWPQKHRKPARWICREPHSYQVPAQPKAGAYWSDDRYGHFRNLAARCSTPAVPGMRARPPMEAGGCLGGPGSDARSNWVKMSSRNVPADFKCPKCSAHYKVVRVKAEPQSPNRLVHCKVCKEPLASMDGEDILKYFLTARPRAVRR